LSFISKQGVFPEEFVQPLGQGINEFTRFKEVLWRSLRNLFNHCIEFYLETRGFFPKEFVQPLGQGINEFTRLKEVLRRFLGNFFNHCLEFYLKKRGFFQKNSFNHLVRESMDVPKIGFVYPSTFQCRLGLPKEFLRASRVIFAQRPLS
jgi:hypothetical protein